MKETMTKLATGIIAKLIRYAATTIGGGAAIGATTGGEIINVEQFAAGLGSIIVAFAWSMWEDRVKRKEKEASTDGLRHVPILLAGVCLVGMTGCLRPPATRFAFNPKTHEIAIRSPKDIELTNLTVSIDTNGHASIKIDSYRSKNNVEVLAEISKANQESRKAYLEAGDRLVEKVIGVLK